MGWAYGLWIVAISMKNDGLPMCFSELRNTLEGLDIAGVGWEWGVGSPWPLITTTVVLIQQRAVQQYCTAEQPDSRFHTKHAERWSAEVGDAGGDGDDGDDADDGDDGDKGDGGDEGDQNKPLHPLGTGGGTCAFGRLCPPIRLLGLAIWARALEGG